MSQPDATVPAMSKMPTTASSPAAVVDGIPWSWAAGTKWVWMMPLVDQPHTQKVSTSAQNDQRRLALRSTSTATRAGDAPVRSASTTTLPGSMP